MKKNSQASRRNPGRQRGYRPNVSLGSIQEGMHNMGVNDPECGIDNFLAGTPDKRANSRRCRGANLPQSKRTPTDRRSEDAPSARTSTNGESFTDEPRNASKRSEKSIATKANGQICIVANGFDITDDDEEKIEECLGEVIHWNQSHPSCLDKMTVLVSSTKPDPHTTPFLVAMSKGVPIVTRKWLLKSLKQGECHPFSDYLLKDDATAEGTDITENVYGLPFLLSDAIVNGMKASGEGGILVGHVFSLCRGIGNGQRDITRKELRVLLQAAGAEELRNVMLEETDTIDNLLVVTSLKATDEQIKYASKFEEFGGMRVSSMVILQVLLLQSKTPLEKLIELMKERAAAKKNAFDAALHTFPRGPAKELLRMKLVEVSRTLSKPDEGDVNRGQLGKDGTLQIVESGLYKYAHYFDQGCNLKFKARVPSKSFAYKELLSNAGEDNCIVWETSNETGDQTMNRRHFFWFHSRAQLDTCLVTMFGIEVNLNNQSILEEWYDENSRCYASEFTLPAHEIVKNKDEMDEEEFSARVRSPPKPRGALMCEYGCDPYAASQQV